MNIYGRKWGRGARPYLLLPKVICACVFLGGLVSVLELAFLGPAPSSAWEWRSELDLIRRGFRHVVVPGLVGALLLGAALLVYHGRVMLRMRWLQVKLLVIAACVPLLHFYTRGKALDLRAAIFSPPLDAATSLMDLRDSPLGDPAPAWAGLRAGTLAAIAFALVVILLGRIKPRLGQDYGRTFGRQPRG